MEELIARVEALELLGPRVQGGCSADGELVEENAALREQVSKLEYRLKIVLRALEETENKQMEENEERKEREEKLSYRINMLLRALDEADPGNAKNSR